MMRTTWLAALAAICTTGLGCGDDGMGPVDSGMGDSAVAVDAGDGATFTMVYNVMQANCGGGSCHLSGPVAAGLDLSSKSTAYDDLVDTPAEGPACGGMGTRVVPGDPEASILYSKVADSPPDCGSRMPAGGGSLTAGQIGMIRSWIASGAPNN